MFIIKTKGEASEGTTTYWYQNVNDDTNNGIVTGKNILETING